MTGEKLLLSEASPTLKFNKMFILPHGQQGATPIEDG